MKTTENLSLKQFEGTDNFDYKVLNENFEAIDNKITENSEVINKLGEKTGVEAGTYGGYDTSDHSYNIPSVTVDEQGRVTKASASTLPVASENSDGYLDNRDYSDFKSSVIKRTYGSVRDFEKTMDIYDSASIKVPSGEYYPRVLNAMIKIYTESSQTTKWWVPVQYRLNVRYSAPAASVLTRIVLEIPEEYREYNINSDGNYEFDYIVEYVSG